MPNNAVFTMRLKAVIDAVHADVATGDRLGLDIYPIFDESYRERLNKKIVDHYWNREIGRETIEDFRFALARTMNEIMPMYNQLYESTKLKFDPLSTMDILNETEGESESASESNGQADQNGESTVNTIGLSNTYPQTALKPNDTANYADAGSEGRSTSDNTATAIDKRNDKANGKSNGKSRTTGYTGPASDLIMRYRATLLNVDMMVILDLNALFMNIWDNGDTYTESGFIA